MEATLPEGTAFNWGGDASAASGGVAGATGAWAEGFTQQFYRPAGATGASWQTLAETSDELNTAMGERTTAEQKLTAVTEQQTAGVAEETKALKDTTGGDGSSLGQSLFSGVLESIGLDGSVFSNPLEWANVKSGMALANWGGGLLQGLMGGSGTEGAPGADLAGGNLALACPISPTSLSRCPTAP
jgi:hypothetical protein